MAKKLYGIRITTVDWAHRDDGLDVVGERDLMEKVVQKWRDEDELLALSGKKPWVYDVVKYDPDQVKPENDYVEVSDESEVE